MTDSFTVLSKLLSEAPLDIQIIINEVLKHKYKFRHVLHSLDKFIVGAERMNRDFLIDRHWLTYISPSKYEILPMRFGFKKYLRHDHIPSYQRGISTWSGAPPILLNVPDILAEIHDTEKYYVDGLHMKVYSTLHSSPENSWSDADVKKWGCLVTSRDDYVGEFMGHVQKWRECEKKTELANKFLQESHEVYETGQANMTAENNLIRRLMDMEEIQINS